MDQSSKPDPQARLRKPKGEELKQMLKRRVIFVAGETPMGEVVAQMRDLNISSVLVLDQNHEVVGIITERDIVQKFTLLELKSKLAAKAMALMSRPVIMARIDTLFDDVRKIFLEKRLRHFPITVGGNHINDIMGIITVTDLASTWMASGTTSVGIPAGQELIVVIVGQEQTRDLYSKLLKALSIRPVHDAENELLIRRAIDHKLPVILDMDGLSMDELKKLLQKLKNHTDPVLVLTSQPNLIEPLRKILNLDVFQIVMKPLDVSEILRLLARVEAQKSQVVLPGKVS